MPYTREQRIKWYWDNRERLLAINAKYRKDHKEELSEKAKQRRLSDPEKTKERDRKYHLKYKDKQLAYSREYNKTGAAKAARKRYIEKNPFYIRQKTQVRRARKTATQTEPINNIIIFERDSWICQICGTAVDINLVYPDPWSSSIDHIIPLSKGGTHTMDNIQLAHLGCNLKKYTRVKAA